MSERRPPYMVRKGKHIQKKTYAIAAEDSGTGLTILVRFAALSLDENGSPVWAATNEDDDPFSVTAIRVFGRDDLGNRPEALEECEPFLFEDESVVEIEKRLGLWVIVDPFYYARPGSAP